MLLRYHKLLCTILIVMLAYESGLSGNSADLLCQDIKRIRDSYCDLSAEEVATLLDGTIPYRGSAEIVFHGGKMVIGRIDDYWGPIQVIWESTESPIPCVGNLSVGMTAQHLNLFLDKLERQEGSFGHARYNISVFRNDDAFLLEIDGAMGKATMHFETENSLIKKITLCIEGD